MPQTARRQGGPSSEQSGPGYGCACRAPHRGEAASAGWLARENGPNLSVVPQDIRNATFRRCRRQAVGETASREAAVLVGQASSVAAERREVCIPVSVPPCSGLRKRCSRQRPRTSPAPLGAGGVLQGAVDSVQEFRLVPYREAFVAVQHVSRPSSDVASLAKFGCRIR
jgi:hypothetical protein